MIYCTCKDKKVINEGDAMFTAYESYCPKHGYFSSCYIFTAKYNRLNV